MAQMDSSEPTNPLEVAREAVQQKMLRYSRRAESTLPERHWQRANAALAAIANAMTNRDNVAFLNSVKTFTNLAGGPPYNTDEELFQIGDEIPTFAQAYWDVKYPEQSQ